MLYLTDYQVATEEKVFSGIQAEVVTPYYSTIKTLGNNNRRLCIYTGLQYLDANENIISETLCGVYIRTQMLDEPKRRKWGFTWKYRDQSPNWNERGDTPTFNSWNETYQVKGKALLDGMSSIGNISGILVYSPGIGVNTTTKTNGSFAFSTEFPPGLYSFVFKYPRYLTQVRYFEVKNGFTTIPSVVLPCGDLNMDNIIDSKDLDIFQAAYASKPGDPNWNPYCDFNKDNKVEIDDLLLFKRNFNKKADQLPEENNIRGKVNLKLEIDSWNLTVNKWNVYAYINDVKVLSTYIRGDQNNKNTYRGVYGIRVENNVPKPFDFGSTIICGTAAKREDNIYRLLQLSEMRDAGNVYEREMYYYLRGDNFTTVEPGCHGNLLQVSQKG